MHHWGMCIRHRTYHILRSECWDSIVAWYMDERFDNTLTQECRNQYQATVEAAMAYDMMIGESL